jgi:hypothetical protein
MEDAMNEKGFTIVEVIGSILIMACVYGWIANIVKIFWAVNETITGLFILRCVGVAVPPLGVVLGYL